MPASNQVELFCAETSMHGFRYLAGTSLVRKCMWFALLIAAIVLMVVQVKQQVDAYKENPIQTNIDIDYKESLPFPAVTICNNNQYRISEAASAEVFDLLVQLNSADRSKINWDAYQHRLAQIGNARQFHNSLISSIENMLIMCKFPDGSECSVADFRAVYTDFGICFALNADVHKPIVVQRSGEKSGIFLMLNIEAYEMMPGPASTTGIKVIIHNQTDIAIASARAIEIPPGYVSQIGINRVIKQKIHKSSGGTCIEEPERHIKFYESKRQYSNEKCELDKIWSEVRHVCECDAYNAPTECVYTDKKAYECQSVEHLSICSVQQSFTCAEDAIAKVEANRKSSQACTQNCTAVELRSALSLSKLPLDTIIRAIPSSLRQRTTISYNKALEARRRVQDRYRNELHSILDQYLAATDYIRSIQMEPTAANFKTSFARMTEVPCFKDDLLGDPDFELYFSAFGPDSFGKISDASEYSAAIYLRAIVDNQMPNATAMLASYNTLLAQYQTEVATLGQQFGTAVVVFGGMFSYGKSLYYGTELLQDMKTYTDIIEQIRQYKTGGITLMQLAQFVNGKEALFIPKFQSEFVTRLGGMAFGKENWYQAVLLMGTANAYYMNSMRMAATTPAFRLLFSVMLMGDKFANTKLTNCDDTILATCPLSAEEYANAMNISRAHTIELALARCQTIFGISESITVRQLICPIDYSKDPTDFIFSFITCATTEVLQLATDYNAKKQSLTPRLSDPWNKLTHYASEFITTAQMNEKFYSENILAVNVYYQDLSEEKYIQKISYDIWMLACDIGGTVGLFLGASIMAVGELIDIFCLRPLFLKLYGQRGGKQVSPNEIYHEKPSEPTVAPPVPSTPPKQPVAEGASTMLVVNG